MSIFMSTFAEMGATRVELRRVAEEHGMKNSGTVTRSSVTCSNAATSSTVAATTDPATTPLK